MRPVAVAFAGAIGVGKTSVSIRVAETLRWSRASFGDYVRAVARERGLDASAREVLQPIGEELIARGWEDFCRAVLAQAAWTPGQPIVIDGIRHIRAVEILRELVAPMPLCLVLLEAGEQVRAARTKRRDDKVQDIATCDREADQHSTEVEVATRLPLMADRVVSAEGELDRIVENIVDWLISTDKHNCRSHSALPRLTPG
jgi:dephospho-CoA kinase